MAPTAQTVLSSPKVGAGSIASRWQELQGSDSWTGLLDPLDADLRASLIAYGELAEAAYDGFNADERSPNAGSCMYTCAGLLAASGVSHPEYYTVTKFLFATCDLRNSPASMSVSKALFLPQRDGPSWRQTNWIGYVAVATDEGKAALGRRDIVVVWRGTVEVMEYIHAKDAGGFASAAQVLHLSPGDSFADARVHAGLLSVYTTNNPPENHHVWLWTLIVLMTSARDQALAEVGRLVEAHKDEVISITVTGHSLGASLATLNAVDIVASGVNVPPHTSSEQQRLCPVTAILFASPLVGDGTFSSAFASFPDLRALHVKNLGDTVLEHPPQELGYADVATATLPIDTSRSPYLRTRIALLDKEHKEEIVRRHNLECYLHCLAGDHGDDKDFKMVVERDVGLVNKGAHALKDEYPAVPANWWAINHKCKVKGVVGRWTFENFKDVDEQSSG